MILVTSLDRKDFPAGDIAALTRLRWRIELAFKRLKSLIRLKVPPGKGEALARTFLLAHLLLGVPRSSLGQALIDTRVKPGHKSVEHRVARLSPLSGRKRSPPGGLCRCY